VACDGLFAWLRAAPRGDGMRKVEKLLLANLAAARKKLGLADHETLAEELLDELAAEEADKKAKAEKAKGDE